MEGISRFCFAASYAVALVLELMRMHRPRPAQRLLGTLFGVAGLVAHTLFLLLRRPNVASPYGSLLVLAWVVAVFYLIGSWHYRRMAWAVFVLPLVLALIALSEAFSPPTARRTDVPLLAGERGWAMVHGILLVLAAVGVIVGFLTSVMYLIQAHRLRVKRPPSRGLRLLSLERLEEMNRRALNLAFPLLTAGLLVGAVLLVQHPEASPDALAWLPKVLGTGGLWMAFLLLTYLRYGVHLSGRRLAFGTIAAFGLLLAALLAGHPVYDLPPPTGEGVP